MHIQIQEITLNTNKTHTKKLNKMNAEVTKVKQKSPPLRALYFFIFVHKKDTNMQQGQRDSIKTDYLIKKPFIVIIVSMSL